MASTSVFNLLAGTALASGDVLPYVDISDTTQSPQGSLLKITCTNFFATIKDPVVVTSASANALAVGRLGATTPAFQVDASTGSQVAGLKVTGAVTGGTVAVVVIDSGANANLIVNAKGSGTIGIGTVSTGAVTITPVTTITGALTLSATLGAVAANFSGLVTANAGATVASGQTLTVTGATITGLTAASVAAGTFPAGAYVFASGGVTITSGGLTVSAGTTAVQALTATTAQLGGAALSKILSIQDTANTNTAQVRFKDLNASVSFGYIGNFSDSVYLTVGGTYTGSWASDNASKAIASIALVSGNADSSILLQTVAANNSGPVTRVTIAKDGFTTFTAGISATTGAFSGDVTLTGAGSDLIVAATAKFRPDGDAAGNTYISETSADELSVTVGGTIVLSCAPTIITVTNSTKFTTAGSTTTRAGLRLPHGTAPTSPVDGDVWTTTAGLYVRVNGATVGPLS